MTDLDGPKARRVVRKTRVRVPHGVTPEMVITLYPGGQIGLRELRRRKEIRLDAGALYVRALVNEVNERRKRR